jgi:hypothetical protein
MSLSTLAVSDFESRRDQMLIDPGTQGILKLWRSETFGLQIRTSRSLGTFPKSPDFWE